MTRRPDDKAARLGYKADQQVALEEKGLLPFQQAVALPWGMPAVFLTASAKRRAQTPCRASGTRRYLLSLRVVSWNINSIRQRLEHVARFTAEWQPDVLCLQETKVRDEEFPVADLVEMGFEHCIFRGQKSYNGVAILSRIPFDAQDHRIWCSKDDKRHLSVTLPFGRGEPIEIHNFYVPSGGPTPDPEVNARFAHKLSFLEEMADWASVHTRGRRVLLVGDLNVAPLEKDVWNHKRQLRSVGHTPGESERIAALLEAGALIDVGRHFVPPDKPLYTWWAYRFPQSFQRDYGWRLDHAFASEPLRAALQRLSIVRETRAWERPSDHVPVVVDLAS